ncbi:MAG: redoxin domain-containing protein [Chloroflexota bacterium]|nr:redoxin domain-containing protein [Chloroflexota bacterium]
MRSDITVGARFPDYELPDHTGRKRRLSDLQGSDPLVLVLLRGKFCPKDRAQLRGLISLWPEMRVGYARLVCISTEDMLGTNELRDGVGAEWPFLSDPGRMIQHDLEIQEYTDPKNDPMIPHTIVLGPGLEIVKIYDGYWYWGRPTPDELRLDLREVTRRIRPDWDLAAPGLREKWDAGERDAFFPYGRKLSEVFAQEAEVRR